jgi:hypothetical protein
MDLLITHTHDSELQVITHHTSQITTSSQSWLDVSWQRILSVEILERPALRSYLFPAARSEPSPAHSTITPSRLTLPCRTQLNCHPSTNWGPGWRLFHTNPPCLVFTGWFSTDNWTGQLNYLLEDNSARTTSKISFFYYWARVSFRGEIQLLTEPLLRIRLHSLILLLRASCGRYLASTAVYVVTA